MQYKRISYFTAHANNFEKYSKEAQERSEKLSKVNILLSEGIDRPIALQIVDLPKTTYYRWRKRYEWQGLLGLQNKDKIPLKVRSSTWSHDLEALVLSIRTKFPVWGKSKIATILQRDYATKISVSMVGRILKKLAARDAIKPASYYIRGPKERKKRMFTGHAQRWKFDMQTKQPGEFIQIDHMHVPEELGAGSLKHFKAVCPFTKYTVENVYKQATSNSAADFLAYAVTQFPFPILSIQVDGGSEFMGEFEEACYVNNIPLFVLPPRSPKLNSCVERGNLTVKSEFFALYEGKMDIDSIRKHLKDYTHMYNNYRPHQHLQNLTPMAYWNLCSLS